MVAEWPDRETVKSHLIKKKIKAPPPAAYLNAKTYKNLDLCEKYLILKSSSKDYYNQLLLFQLIKT